MSFPTILESISDLNREQIEHLLISSKTKINLTDNGQYWERYTSKFKTKPIISTFFFEPSTRTKNSFLVAALRSGCHTLDFKADESSIKKGEQLDETIKTLKYQGVELIIIRSNKANILNEFKINPIIPMINGGDGSNQHPTQALTDLFTALNLKHIKENQNLLIVGDAKYSRVIHSLIPMFKLWNINILISTLSYFLPNDMDNIEYIEDINQALAKADMVYILRPQIERHTSDSDEYKEIFNELVSKYKITAKRLNNLNKFVPIYHPGPANIGVEIDEEIIKSKNYQAYQQVKHSIFMRMSLIEESILNYRKPR